jgi:hypothetical protein
MVYRNAECQMENANWTTDIMGSAADKAESKTPVSD